MPHRDKQAKKKTTNARKGYEGKFNRWEIREVKVESEDAEVLRLFC